MLSPNHTILRADTAVVTAEIVAASNECLQTPSNELSFDGVIFLDEIIRAVSADGFVSIAAITSRALTERARVIHNSSPVATAALGRVLAATSILGDSMKNEEASVTVRIDGGGPMGTIIAVSDAFGNVRCTAGNASVDLPLRPDNKLDVGGAVGSDGMLSVIRDEGSGEPFTGSVALVSGEIAEDFAAYFHASEQIPTVCAFGVLIDRDRTVKAAGGYIVKLLPGSSDDLIDTLEKNVAETGAVTGILNGGTPDDIVERVLNGLDPRVLERKGVEYKCYCSRERVLGALSGLTREDVADIVIKNEPIEVTCSFCDAVFAFSPDEICLPGRD